ncbi:MAG: hypothetical protein ACK502_07975 [Alphaproteobacteria bacterium]
MSMGHKKSDANTTRKETAGEVLFDRGVYTGINFVVNEALSMVMAVELRHFGGKAHFEKASQWWMKKVGFKDKVIKGVTTSALTRAEDQLEVFTLLGGGTALVVPMKILEDNKQQVVKNLNHLWDKLSGKNLDADAAKARDEEVEKAIACEAKQTWKSMLIGRAIATVNNMFLMKETIFAGSRTKALKDWSERYGRIGVEKLHNMTGNKPDSVFAKLKTSERYKRYSEIFGLETAYTAISSVVMEVASKFLARKDTVVKDPKKCEEAQAEQILASASVVPAALPVETQEKPPSVFADKVEPRKKEPCKSCSSHLERVTAEQAQPVQPSL